MSWGVASVCRASLSGPVQLPCDQSQVLLLRLWLPSSLCDSISRCWRETGCGLQPDRFQEHFSSALK